MISRWKCAVIDNVNINQWPKLILVTCQNK